MITYSGIHVQKIGGADGTPTPTDIAVQAGRVSRYGGAIWNPLLPHLVFVGMLANRRGGNFDTVAWAFLHDAHEIVTGEVPRPFKCDCMRREQQAIDGRLLREFHLDPGQIDWNLIKRCDIDACHIEAVQLGLPTFAETEIKCADDYTGSTEIYTDPDDVKLFHGIIRRPFGYVDTIEGPSAYGVEHFIDLLEEIKRKDHMSFGRRVVEWDIWFMRDPQNDGDLTAPKHLDFRGTEECREALRRLVDLMDKYDLPQVIVNRTNRGHVDVLFHTQTSYAAHLREFTEEMHAALEESDEFERLPDGKYRPIDPLDKEVLDVE